MTTWALVKTCSTPHPSLLGKATLAFVKVDSVRSLEMSDWVVVQLHNSSNASVDVIRTRFTILTLRPNKISIRRESPRRPGHATTAENVNVQVRHALPAIFAVVDDQPVAAFV